MNPLLDNMNFQTNNNGLTPELSNNIAQVKNLLNTINKTPAQLLNQNPAFNQIMQVANMYKGQNLEQVFKSMCASRGIDPNAVLNELLKR